jgi:hypothetical protein
LLAGVTGLAALCVGGTAKAYRPFDGTDADVADAGVFELELGPTEFYRQGARNYLIAPSTVLNLGVAPNLELVADLRQEIATRAEQRERRASWRDTDLLLKWLLRRGSLQERNGISVALEAGPLLPEWRGDEGFGAQANFIFSERVALGTLHLNEEAALSRLGRVELFSSVIIEGPDSLSVRPVAEFFLEREISARPTAYSGLFGLIWSAAESLDVDGALRMGREDGSRALEVRFGFTWAGSAWALSRSRATRSARRVER